MNLRFASGFLIFMLTASVARANSPEQIFVQVSPSVVVVDILDAKGKSIGLGSGAVIGAGQVITNCHVAQKGKSLQVRQSGKIFKATLQYADPDRDLCQLSAPDLKAPPVALGTAKKLRVGQRVYAIGAPKGLELTLSDGLISSLRQYEGSQYIQTSAAISPGSSGGGLFDDQGRLIGITSFQFIEGQNLNFALPVDWIGELPKRARYLRLVPDDLFEEPMKKSDRFANAPIVRNVPTVRKGGLDWLNRAAALEQKEDWQGMLKLSQQWVKSEPGSAVASFGLGNAYDILKQYDQAIQAYLEAQRIQLDALRLQPEGAGAWSTLGTTYIKLKKYDQAIQAYREALRIAPEDAEAWYNLGATYYLQGQRVRGYNNFKQYDQAIQAYREALRIAPEDAEAWYSLGASYYLQGQRDKVREVYPILRKLDPAMADRYFNTFILP
jgi:tetratricopeptide (TPR) repeat protein